MPLEAFRRKASAYLLKDSAASELTTAIRQALQGRSYVSPLLAVVPTVATLVASIKKERPMRKGLMIVTVLLAGASVAAAGTSKDEMKRVTDAARVLREIRAAPDKNIPESIWQRARCVAVMPDVKKAAFVVGGELRQGSDELPAPAPAGVLLSFSGSRKAASARRLVRSRLMWCCSS